MKAMRIATRISTSVITCVLVTGCATSPEPTETRSSDPVRPPMTSPVPVITPPRPPVAPAAPHAADRQGQALALALLPPSLTKDRSGWATDIATAFTALRLAPTPENVCTTMAIVEQESGFQADPEVPGLSRIAWREMESRRQRHNIPKFALDLALDKSSPDGRTYRQSINSVRTERQMSLIYSDIIDEVPGGKLLLSGYNPVRTGGPMQVSIDFAKEHAQEKPYGTVLAKELGGDLRNAVFTRRGGLYFGIAHLLDYPAPYRDPIYRFADFNAGRYSSRNAAFQQAVSQLTGKTIPLDGDLLRYENGAPSKELGTTQRAILKLAGRLKLSTSEITAGLQQEKQAGFVQTSVYLRLFALADEVAGKRMPREVIPGIDLKSPKIRSKITTAWFADRVNGRYITCLKHIPKL